MHKSDDILYAVDALGMASAAVEYVQSYLRSLGKIEVIDGELRVSGLLLKGDTAIVDMVKQKFGFGCTIFQGNVRIATTAVAADSQERALGTTTNAQITQQVYRRGETFRGITRTIGKDWLIVYTPLRDFRSKIVGMIATYRELYDFLGNLKLLDSTPEAVLLHGMFGHMIDANHTACDMLGSCREELLQKKLQDFAIGLTPQDLAEAATVPHNQPLMYESHWQRTDGYAFPVILSVCKMELPQGPMMLTIVRDFTAQFEARKKLRSLNEKLQRLNASLEEKVAHRTQMLQDTLTQRAAMLNHLSDGLLATNEQGVITACNPAMKELMGWQRAEPQHLPVSTLHDGFAEIIQTCIEKNLGFVDTLLLPNNNAGEITISPIFSEGSQTTNPRCIGSVMLVRELR